MAQNQGMPQSARSILNWILVIGIAAFILLIMVIIFGNLSGNVGFGQDSLSFSNEVINLTVDGNTPSGADNRINGVISGLVMTNATTSAVVTSENYTIQGVIISSTQADYNNTNFNVTYTISFDEQGKIDSDNIIGNYTLSATNTSAQFPTVGTIIGIALLLLILIALLIFVIQKMMGVSTASNNSSSGKFSGSDQGFG